MELKYKIDRHSPSHIMPIMLLSFLQHIISLCSLCVSQFHWFGLSFFALSLYSRFVWAFHFEREQQKEWESMCCCSFFSTSGWLFSTISSKGPLTHLLTRTFSSKEWFLFNFHFVLLLLFELKLKLLYGKHMGHICPSTHLCRTLSIQRILLAHSNKTKPETRQLWFMAQKCIV